MRLFWWLAFVSITYFWILTFIISAQAQRIVSEKTRILYSQISAQDPSSPENRINLDPIFWKNLQLNCDLSRLYQKPTVWLLSFLLITLIYTYFRETGKNWIRRRRIKISQKNSS
ncbi:hypothetical protein J3R74_000082 [Puniceicoccus vermicola]